MPDLIQERVPSDSVRERHFVERILEVQIQDGAVLALLGKEHVVPVVEMLNAAGQVAAIQRI
jgi:hypothetical protein